MKLRTSQLEVQPRARAVEVASEQSSAERLFDVERDLTPADQEQLVRVFKVYRDPERHQELFSILRATHIAADYMLIFPDKRHALELDDNFYNDLLPGTQQRRSDDYVRLVLLYPERKADLSMNELFDEWVGALQSYGFPNVIERIRDLYILFPDRKEEIGAEQKMSMYIQMANQRAIDIWDRLSVWASLAVIYPEHRKEWNLDDLIIEAKEKLQQVRERQDWFSFAKLAALLRLLTADEVKVTAQGIECIDYNELESASELPSRRMA